jgi:hypothetical protein
VRTIPSAYRAFFAKFIGVLIAVALANAGALLRRMLSIQDSFSGRSF